MCMLAPLQGRYVQCCIQLTVAIEGAKDLANIVLPPARQFAGVNRPSRTDRHRAVEWFKGVMRVGVVLFSHNEMLA